MQKRVIIIGAGTGGLATACLLAKDGYKVTVYDKNEQPGGRNSRFTEKGFTFNYGPSWYLMPDVFEHYFELLGEDITKHLSLLRLSPGYRVFFKDTLLGATDIYGDPERDGTTFESFEPGAKIRLLNYLDQAGQNYNLATEHFLYKNYESWRDYQKPAVLREMRMFKLLGTLHKHIAKQFKSVQLQKILEYPAVFLGGSPYNIPALYSVLSHVDLNQGVFYPKGGLYAVTEALAAIAKQHGVKIICNQEVTRLTVESRQVSGIRLSSGKTASADIVISGAGIQNTEQNLLDPKNRMYSNRYWKKRVHAPSAMLIHLGVSGKLPELAHHNLLFSKKWKSHFDTLFGKKAWPGDPSIYICNPTKTDPDTAPKNHENLTILIPLASGLTYSDDTLETYANHILSKLEETLHLNNLRARIVYKKLFCVRDFAERYNAPQGTALGLAHTLRQSAAFRPSNIHKKVKNLYFVGADTTPGIGIPMCLISAELVQKRIIASLQN